MGDPKKRDDKKEEKGPESWKKFVDLARAVVNVPKDEIHRLIESEREHKERAEEPDKQGSETS
jgi:hypothetical protein